MKRLLILNLLLLMLSCGEQTENNDPLVFPKDDFETYTIQVPTSKGTVDVEYLAYMHIPYVANPLDTAYQSLNVFKPVKIDGKEIDANGAPIFFAIGVGGYMSVNNAQSDGDLNPKKDENDHRRHFRGMNASDPGTLLALANGYVVVAPGVRGRDNQSADGKYYGKAPAAIVDLKAAVRYVRHNKGIIPGNTDWIISKGCSAGGALSALLGASGNSHLYDSYLREIGAANEEDQIYGTTTFSPITDLEHADGAYEWMFGEYPTRNGMVDQELSAKLKDIYSDYQSSLQLEGKNGFGLLTADNYGEYLLTYYTQPSATSYLRSLSEEERNSYLEKNPWITWTSDSAYFTFNEYVRHVGRMKGLPAFDDFDKKQPEPIEFGSANINARHFTNFSLQHTDSTAQLSEEVEHLTHLMNPMYFLMDKNQGAAAHWWIRNGTSDPHTSQTIAINLATSLENMDRDVNTYLFWDGGHCADEDAEGMMDWIAEITGYKR